MCLKSSPPILRLLFFARGAITDTNVTCATSRLLLSESRGTAQVLHWGCGVDWSSYRRNGGFDVDLGWVRGGSWVRSEVEFRTTWSGHGGELGSFRGRSQVDLGIDLLLIASGSGDPGRTWGGPGADLASIWVDQGLIRCRPLAPTASDACCNSAHVRIDRPHTPSDRGPSACRPSR